MRKGIALTGLVKRYIKNLRIMTMLANATQVTEILDILELSNKYRAKMKRLFYGTLIGDAVEDSGKMMAVVIEDTVVHWFLL